MLRVIVAMLLAGCGTAPPAPAPAEPGGFVTVTIARAPGAEPGFFAQVHRARLIGVDGSVAAAWQVMEPATPVQVEPGVYRLDVFTIFLNDVYVCEIDPAAPGGSRCGQPTMGPAQVCNLDVEVVAGQQAHATFHVLREGLCGLETAPSPTLPDQESQKDEHEAGGDQEARPLRLASQDHHRNRGPRR